MNNYNSTICWIFWVILMLVPIPMILGLRSRRMYYTVDQIDRGYSNAESFKSERICGWLGFLYFVILLTLLMLNLRSNEPFLKPGIWLLPVFVPLIISLLRMVCVYKDEAGKLKDRLHIPWVWFAATIFLFVVSLLTFKATDGWTKELKVPEIQRAAPEQPKQVVVVTNVVTVQETAPAPTTTNKVETQAKEKPVQKSTK